MGQEGTLYSGYGHDSASCLDVDKLGPRANRLNLGFKSGRSMPSCVSWSGCVTDSDLWMSKSSGWDFCSGTAGMNLVCQKLCGGCCKPFWPSVSQSDCQWLSPTDSPVILVVQGKSRVSYKVTHTAGRGWFFPGRIWKPRSPFCKMFCCLEERRCCQCVTTSLTLWL